MSCVASRWLWDGRVPLRVLDPCQAAESFVLISHSFICSSSSWPIYHFWSARGRFVGKMDAAELSGGRRESQYLASVMQACFPHQACHWSSMLAVPELRRHPSGTGVGLVFSIVKTCDSHQDISSNAAHACQLAVTTFLDVINNVLQQYIKI